MSILVPARAMNSVSMVEKYLRKRGIRDERVLEVMGRIPRHHFVPEALKEKAYSDHPLPIGEEQTISQPYIVALMTEALHLKGTEKVLEIGTGSGYQTAILAELSRSVFSVERIRSLGQTARKRLEDLGYSKNVSIKIDNGLYGWKDYGPFDRIIVTAAARGGVPKTLIDQLAEGGRMVIPVVEGDEEEKQKLYLIEKTSHGTERRFLCYCSFVPFVFS